MKDIMLILCKWNTLDTPCETFSTATSLLCRILSAWLATTYKNDKNQNDQSFNDTTGCNNDAKSQVTFNIVRTPHRV